MWFFNEYAELFLNVFPGIFLLRDSDGGEHDIDDHTQTCHCGKLAASDHAGDIENPFKNDRARVQDEFCPFWQRKTAPELLIPVPFFIHIIEA